MSDCLEEFTYFYEIFIYDVGNKMYIYYVNNNQPAQKSKGTKQ